MRLGFSTSSPPLLRGLHLLPVNARIQFKILLITLKEIEGLAPKYLCYLLTFKSFLYNLRSSGSLLLSMPAVRSKNTLGDRSFMVAAPTLWNSLPKELRATTNVNSFKAQINLLVINFVFSSYLHAYIFFLLLYIFQNE